MTLEDDEIKAVNALIQMAELVDIDDKEAMQKYQDMIDEGIATELITHETKLRIIFLLVCRRIRENTEE